MQIIPMISLLLVFSIIGCSSYTPSEATKAPSSVNGQSAQPIPEPPADKTDRIESSLPISLGIAGEVASYYNRHLAIKDGTVYGWTGDDKPQALLENAVQVGVGDTTGFALLKDGQLIAWTEDPKAAVPLMKDVVSFSSGRTGIFAIKTDSSLWRFDSPDKPGTEVAKDVVFASIGDGTDYYITKQGELFARGLAHRGQYGTGSLEAASDFIQVASDAVQVRGHTGHAVLLKRNGDVQGTGGNIYGPLSTHGLGDKATVWGTIFTGASLIATGSSHSAVIKRDGSLWIWGGKEGATPRQVMEETVAVAAGNDVTIAKKKDGSIWYWKTGQEPHQIL
ncbi:MAG: Alpha-tubulin suppressor and related protein-like protein [Paenibacillus sp.]|jgi:alpha-tubulin suppressor-like RCC1 family protein|nr:Alpha-tubulin suppressor and related protein-like protein [Paenibacillus sp.]